MYTPYFGLWFLYGKWFSYVVHLTIFLGVSLNFSRLWKYCARNWNKLLDWPETVVCSCWMLFPCVFDKVCKDFSSPSSFEIFFAWSAIFRMHSEVGFELAPDSHENVLMILDCAWTRFVNISTCFSSTSIWEKRKKKHAGQILYSVYSMVVWKWLYFMLNGNKELHESLWADCFCCIEISHQA